MKITSNHTEFTLKFGYGFLRLLGDAWGCEGPVAITGRFMKGAAVLIDMVDAADKAQSKKKGPQKDVEIPFECIDVFVDVIHAAALNENKGAEIDKDAIADYVFSNIPVMGEVTRLFIASMPKVTPAESTGKPMPAAKPGKNRLLN